MEKVSFNSNPDRNRSEAGNEKADAKAFAQKIISDIQRKTGAENDREKIRDQNGIHAAFITALDAWAEKRNIALSEYPQFSWSDSILGIDEEEQVATYTRGSEPNTTNPTIEITIDSAALERVLEKYFERVFK